MIRSLRTAGRVLAVSALTVSTVPFGSASQADAVRTDTKLAGFSVTVEATPLRILLDDPELQIPHDPGTAVLEADPNYTLASVSAGPNARALTSTLWPGNLLGEGLAQLASGHAYPVKGEARYPDKPYDQAGPTGQLGDAHAEGLDATATADGAPTDKAGQITLGTVSSASTATVNTKDVAVGTARSSVSDVNVLGLINIASVKTVLSTEANGKKPDSSGTTTVSGLTIAGQHFSVDDKGLHAASTSSALPALDTPAEVSKTLGITAHVLMQSTASINGGVKRVAGGLVIDVDTGPLRALLKPATTVVNPLANQVIASLPKQLAPVSSQLYYLVKATPHITFIFASANASSAATLPLAIPPFSFPSFPTLPGTAGTPPIQSVPGRGVDVIPGITPADPTAPITAGGDPGGSTPPVIAGSGIPLSSSSPSAGFAGIGIGWLLGTFLGAGLIGWGLLRFLGLAGGGALGVGCRLGAPTTVPNLRSVTS